MRLFIPTCGSVLRLTADWTMTIQREHRNDGIIDAIRKCGVGPSNVVCSNPHYPNYVTEWYDFTLPAKHF